MVLICSKCGIKCVDEETRIEHEKTCTNKKYKFNGRIIKIKGIGNEL